MSNLKKVSIVDFLTPAEIDKAVELGEARAICSKIIEPNIDRINKALGQECDPMYLAYMTEFTIQKARED